MEFLIDGYNVLHEDPEAFGLLTRSRMPTTRDRFAAAVDRFCSETRGKALVVFDGAGEAPSGGFERVRVLYAGSRSADEVLKEIVDRRAGPSGRTLVLVSSDREIVRHAKGADLPTLTSALFLKKMRRKAKSAREELDAERNPRLNPADVDAWMEEFGFSTTEDTEKNKRTERKT